MIEIITGIGGALLSLLVAGLSVKHPRVAQMLLRSLPPHDGRVGHGGGEAISSRDYADIIQLIRAETGGGNWAIYGPQLILSEAGKILAANDAARQLLARGEADLRSLAYRDLLAVDAEGFLGQWVALTAGEVTSYRRTERLIKRGGGNVIVEAAVARVPDATHEQRPVVHVMLVDRTEIEALEARVAHLESMISGERKRLDLSADPG